MIFAQLQQKGWVEGRNYILVARFAADERDSVAAIAEHMVRANPDVILTSTAHNVQLLLRHTRTIPIVTFTAGVLTPDENVVAMARPGGNVTGMQMFSPELMAKRLELLTELVPRLERVAVLRGDNYPPAILEEYTRSTNDAAKKLGIRVRYFKFKLPTELDSVFAAMAAEQDQALLVWGNPHLFQHKERIFELSQQYRLPAIHELRNFNGALITYGPRLEAVAAEAANYVDRILKGANPAELPIGQPRTFDLVINLRAARAIGLVIPKLVLVRADEVIE